MHIVPVRPALLFVLLLCVADCGGGGSDGAAGAAQTPFSFGTGFDNSVFTIAPANDGSGGVFVGGFFTAYDGAYAGHFVRLNASGNVDASFSNAFGFDGSVNTIAPAVSGSGDVYVGGSFASYNGLGASRIVRLKPSGTIDSGFVTGTGFDHAVFTIVPADDGSGGVYVGGDFTTYNGTAVNRIVRLNSDGTIDSGFATGTGFNESVRAIVLTNDGSGDIYAGGIFTAYNGAPANHIARLNANGTRDAGFVSGGFDFEVYSMGPTVDASGDIYVGGIFLNYNGSPANEIARLKANGAADAGAIAFGFNNTVVAIAPARDGSGDVYIGGDFTTYNVAPAKHIVRLKTNGTVNASFAVGAGFTGDPLITGVFAVALANDGSGDVFVGGFFNAYQTKPTGNIVRLDSRGTAR